MKKLYIFFLSLAIPLAWLGCNKVENFELSAQADDRFFLVSDKASMPVLVQGNTASKILLLIVHGGPGGDAISAYNGKTAEGLKEKYGLVFWDQRASGSSQGTFSKRNLTVASYIADLEKLVILLKKLYGTDTRIFLYSHSWGGALACSYLIKDFNQTNIQGWINADGLHNYPSCAEFSRLMLISEGQKQIASGKNIEKWKEIVDYAIANPDSFDLNTTGQMNSYAFDAEGLMDEIHPSQDPLSLSEMRRIPMSLVSMKANEISLGFENDFYLELARLNLTSSLFKIKLPTICLWGKLDFVVPEGVANDLIQHIGSTDINKVVFSHSGHSPMDNQYQEFNAEVIKFVEAHK